MVPHGYWRVRCINDLILRSIERSIAKMVACLIPEIQTGLTYDATCQRCRESCRSAIRAIGDRITGMQPCKLVLKHTQPNQNVAIDRLLGANKYPATRANRYSCREVHAVPKDASLQ